jgi:uncharacterized membrane protein
MNPTLPALGRLLFAVSMVAFGILQLATGEFVRWIPALPAWMPGPSVWAYLIGVLFILAGAAIATGTKAREATAVLAALIVLVILFLHLPKAAADPLKGFMWTNPFKALALLGAVLIVAGFLPEREADRSSKLARFFRRLAPLGPLFFAAFLILGGIQHFVYADFVMKLVPTWIPGSRFWVYFTGLALIAGGAGLLLPKTHRLAATLVGLMLLLWVVLLHVPRALADLHNAGETSGVFEALALSGAAFVVSGRRERGSTAIRN